MVKLVFYLKNQDLSIFINPLTSFSGQQRYKDGEIGKEVKRKWERLFRFIVQT